MTILFNVSLTPHNNMQGLFALMMGGMLVFNGALIVYFLGNAYVIPQYFPNHSFNFGESIVFVILLFFVILVFFGNKVTRIRKNPLKLKPKQTLNN